MNKPSTVYPALVPLPEQGEVKAGIVLDGGALKSDAPSHEGTLTKSGYEVVFQRLYEVHGQIGGPGSSPNDATLLVLKVSPRADQGRYFKSCRISLTVEHDPGDKKAYTSDKPTFKSYEPAQDGVWYIGEHMISRSETGETQANASGEIPGGVSIGFSASKSVTEESSKRILHTVEAKSAWRPGSGRDASPYQITWTLKPAEKSNGIGDYMAVALLVKQHRGSKFVLQAESTAKVGLRAKLGDLFDGSVGITLGPFGTALRDDQIQNIPSGISANNLGAASRENLLQSLAFIHVPEKREARQVYGYQAPNLQPPNLPASLPSVTSESVTQLPPEIQSERNPKTAEPTPPVSRQLLTHGLQPVSQQPRPQVAAEINVHPLADAEIASSFVARPRTAPVQGSRIGEAEARQKALCPFASVSIVQARAMRHRRMAALYQRLAKLHMEEAQDADRAYGEMYADEAEQEEYE